MTFVFHKISRIFYILLIVSLVALLVFFYYNSRKAKSAGDLVEHTEEVLRKSNEVLLDIITIETGARGYILTGNEGFLTSLVLSAKTIDKKIAHLKTLSKDNPKQQIRVDSMMKTGIIRGVFIENIINQKKNNTLNEANRTKFVNESIELTALIRSRITQFNREEFRLLKERKEEIEQTNTTSEIAFIAIILLILSFFTLLGFLLQNQKIKADISKELEINVQERTIQLRKVNDLLREKNLEVIETNAKLLSEYSRSLIEASLDPLITISSEGIITDLNEAFSKITGKTHNELKGTNFIDYFTEPEMALKGYQEVFTKGFVVDFPLTIKDHKPTDVLFNGSVYKDEKGNVLGAVVVARDITERKKIERELNEAKLFAELATIVAEEAKVKAESATLIAENAVKSKQQFLANMSHEIRTPMNAIIGFTRVVLKTDLSSKQKEYINAIKLSGDAMIVLINDILDLAKVDAGKMLFEQTPFKLKASISAMLHLFETKIQEKNLRLIKEYDNKIPEVLLGDSVRLHQIILNLVSNAVKFTNKGTITLSINLLKEDDQKISIEFAVIDTGIGIKKEKIEAIFENFQQETSETTRLYGGTGLGLAIAKQLVEAQGGTIIVKSEVGEGSSFSFILDFQKAKAETELTTDIMELDKEIKNIKVLVAEDMALNQLLMRTLLDDFGFECEIADNGKIAVEMLASASLGNQPYDIILMDLQMPEMNGFEATDYIRNTMKSDIPIIALTADVTTVDVTKCKEVGMDDCVSKPVDEKILYSKIVGLLKKTPLLVATEAIVAQIEQIKLTNLSYLNQRTKSNPKLMMEMISVYLEQTPPLISSMKQSLLDKDWVMLNSAVHKMLPSFAIMGMSTDFEIVAKKIQEYASTLEMTDKIHDLVVQLENACGQACKELEEEFNKINTTK